ncbi:hypothetical protein [Coleofasciculus sp. G2-EDA-02]
MVTKPLLTLTVIMGIQPDMISLPVPYALTNDVACFPGEASNDEGQN